MTARDASSSDDDTSDDDTSDDDVVDRAQIRRQLALSPEERLASVRDVGRMLAVARPVRSEDTVEGRAVENEAADRPKDRATLPILRALAEETRAAETGRPGE